jgi:hypothetical protein
MLVTASKQTTINATLIRVRIRASQRLILPEIQSLNVPKVMEKSKMSAVWKETGTCVSATWRIAESLAQ